MILNHQRKTKMIILQNQRKNKTVVFKIKLGDNSVNQMEKKNIEELDVSIELNGNENELEKYEIK